MFYCTGFTFNGTHSNTYNVILANGGGGETSAPLGIGGLGVIEDKITRIDRPLFLGIDRNVMAFDFSIYKNDGTYFSESELKALSTWLLQKTYKPLISDGYPNTIYKVIFTKLEKIIVGNMPIGVSLTAKCDAPYPYLAEQTQVITHDSDAVLNFTVDTRPSNYSDYYWDWEIEIELMGANTGFTIVNTSDSNRNMVFTGLTALEKIYINNKRKEITSSLSLNRFPNFNLKWLRLVPNTNNALTLTGRSKITVRYSLPILH